VLGLLAAGVIAAAAGTYMSRRPPPPPPPTLDQIAAAVAAHQDDVALRDLVPILPPLVTNTRALDLLRAIFADMTDPTTGEPHLKGSAAPPTQVVFILREYASAHPGETRDDALLGRYALLADLNDVALDALRRSKAAGTEPDPVLLGLALLRANRPDDLLMSINADPSLPPARRALVAMLRARAALRLERYDAARLSLRDALSAQPGNLEALTQLGLLELWHGDPAAAADLSRKAFAVDREAPATLQLAAELDFATADYAGSAKLYGQLADRGGGGVTDPLPPLLGRARALIYQGDVAGAQQALDAAGRDPKVQFFRALLEARQGHFAKAGELAEGLDSRLSGFPPLDLLLGTTMLATGYPETATRRLRHYHAMMPDDHAAEVLLDAAETRAAHHGGDTPPPQQVLLTGLGFPPPR
jgi:tetratricopeptide (TPR) repeat protein